MAAVNIGAANADDQFYRYKMPKLVARIEGRGNGIKTNVVNNVDIAKALERPPEYLVKWFGNELGAVTKYDKKSGSSIVNGAHDAGALSKILEGFINTYVQCYACKNPETTVKVKREMISLKCKACGHLSDVDMRHKLNTFILKNPPEDKVSKAEKRLKKMEKERLKEAAGENLDKEEKRRKKKEREARKKRDASGTGEGDDADGNGGSDDADDDAEDDEQKEEVVWMTDTSAEAAQKRAEEQLTSAMADMVTQGNIEAEQKEQRRREKEELEAAERKAAEEAAAAEAEAERQRAEAAAAAAEKAKQEQAAPRASANGSAHAAPETSAAMAEAVEALRKVLAKTKSAAKVSDAVAALDVEGGLAGRMRALYEALFAEGSDAKLAAQIARRKPILQAVGRDGFSQLAQLLGLEYLVGVTAPERLAEASLALKSLYDEDIVGEDLILGWADKPTAGKVLGIPAAAAMAVRSSCAKFLEWLKEAEEEEEESDDDSLADEN